MLIPYLSTLTNWATGLIGPHLRLQAITVSSRNLLPSEQFRKQTQGDAITQVTFSAWNPGPQLLHSFKIGLLSAEPLERLLMTCPEECPFSDSYSSQADSEHSPSYQLSKKSANSMTEMGINLCYSNSLSEHCQWEAHSMTRKLSDSRDNTHGKCLSKGGR